MKADTPTLMRTRQANGVEAADESILLLDVIKDLWRHTSHDTHAEHNVLRIGNLNAVLGQGRSDWAHGKGDDVQGTVVHATRKAIPEGLIKVLRGDPLTKNAFDPFSNVRDCSISIWRAYEGLRLDTGNIFGVGTADVVILVGRQFTQSPTFKEFFSDLVGFGLATVADEDVLRSADIGLNESK